MKLLVTLFLLALTYNVALYASPELKVLGAFIFVTTGTIVAQNAAKQAKEH